MTYTILVAVQVVIALVLIGLILVQHGKGADAGAAFGSGASGTVFGAKGSANFMSHATAGLATIFFVLSLALAYMVGGNSSAPTGSSVTEQLQNTTQVQKILDTETKSQTTSSADKTSKESTSGATKQGTDANDGVTATIPE